MKLSLLFLLLIGLPLLASTERKIIIGSFPTQQQADNALEVFESKLDSRFKEQQRRSRFNVTARPSGNTYIIAIEPIENYKTARHIKALLPREYSDAFINRYTPPKAAAVPTIPEETKSDTTDVVPITAPKPLPQTEASTAHSQEQPEPPLPEPVAPAKQQQSMHEALPTHVQLQDGLAESKLLAERFVPLEYLLIGVSLLALILLLCLIRYYKKYHHLKKQLASGEYRDERNSTATSSKSSDIFFVRQH